MMSIAVETRFTTAGAASAMAGGPVARYRHQAPDRFISILHLAVAPPELLRKRIDNTNLK